MKKEKTMREQAGEILMKMALGSAADSVKLLMKGDSLTERQIKRLNLYNVAAVKRGSGGITEIKYFDRLKAIQCLIAFAENGSDTQSSFLEALRSCASGNDEEDEE